MNPIKEFVPGTGLVHTHDISSDTPPRPDNKLSDNAPYWSPASKLSGVRMDKTKTAEASSSSVLAVTAKEFIPSSSKPLTASSSDAYSTTGLNLSANEWLPTKSVESGYHESNPQNESAGQHSAEEMVEVTWNGSTVFVPESMAYAYSAAIEGQSSQQLMLEGMEWAASASTLPAPPKRSLLAVGIPEPMRQHFQSLDLDCLRQMDPDDDRYKEIPVRYHSAYPLDDPSSQRGAGGSFGYPSSLYKVVDRADSQLYALRRFDNVRLINPSVLKNSQSKWTAVRHPSIVTLYSISVEKGAIFFAHAHHPAAQTLKQRFLDPRSATSGGLVGESLLWRLLAQLLAGVRLVHSRNMAVRSISPAHILLTSGARFRITNVGVADVLEFESRKSTEDMQIEDLLRLGCVVLSVAARSMVTPKTMEAGMNLLQQHFSSDLCRVVAALLTGNRSAEQVCHMMYDKMCDELDFAMASSDALHLNLRSEYENGRMFRLLAKLGLINERPEFSLSPSWSETGDRYVLQLFRDYLFHQTDLEGVPVIDMGHVVSSLNKLDAGDPEKILLSSRDGKDLLAVSFSDVRRCMEMSIVDLLHQSQQHSNMAPHQMSGSGGPAASHLPMNISRGGGLAGGHSSTTYPPGSRVSTSTLQSSHGADMMSMEQSLPLGSQSAQNMPSYYSQMYHDRSGGWNS
mmetsp:Transcript_22495/g.32850  ORF Transcript_22495/g.32850 Transcript_22495/m.32850 type:complete len:683 (+) Transcript_22495:91-2139(+)